MLLKLDLFAIPLLPDSMVVQWQPTDINRGNAVFKTLLCHYASEGKGRKLLLSFALFHLSFHSYHHTKFTTAECNKCTDRELLCWFKVSVQLSLCICTKNPASHIARQARLRTALVLHHFPWREMISLWNTGGWHLFSCCVYTMCAKICSCEFTQEDRSICYE